TLFDAVTTLLGLPLGWFQWLVLTVVYSLHGMSTMYFLSVAYLMINLTPFEATVMRAYAPRPSSILFLGMAFLHLTPFLLPLRRPATSAISVLLCKRSARIKSLAAHDGKNPSNSTLQLRIPPNVSMAIGHFFEIVSETWIAAQMAQRLVDRHVSFLYAMVLASNCLITTWALLFRSSGLKRALIGLLDACLSFLLSAGIPLFLFLIPLVEYKFYGSGNESHNFVWLARSVTSVRTLIVWSPIQPVMVVVPSIMNYIALRAATKRVRSTASIHNVRVGNLHSGQSLSAPTASLDGSMTGRGSKRASVQAYLAGGTQAFSWHQDHARILVGVIVLSILWGLAVLVVAIAAEFYREPCPPGCVLDSAPWFSRSCNCIYFRWTCNATNYHDVVDAKLNASQIGPNLLFLHIQKCSLRHGLAADTVSQFQSMYGFHFEQTGMVEWNMPSSAIPSSVVLAMIRYSALDHVPLALQNPGANLRSIFIVGASLRAIPAHIFANWQHLNSLWLTSTNLTEFPPQILQMDGLEVLALDSNHISTLPPDLHKLPLLNWLYLESNNISVFPDALVTARTGVYLYLNYNPIDFIADDVVAQLDPWYVDISSTVFCQQRQLPSLCREGCSNTCSPLDQTNHFCDPQCNSTECRFDNGDCEF
ncbi:hypothetical protein DYB32_008452, partial [Aphanomyces invadans]